MSFTETKWKTALTFILQELDESEYKMLLFSLNKIPKSLKTGKAREELPQLIIQCYGAEESVFVINKEIKKIPRMDRPVQDRLRPFVDKVKSKRQQMNKNQQKRSQPAKKKNPPQNQKGRSQPATKARAGKVVQNSAKRKANVAGPTKPKQRKTKA